MLSVNITCLLNGFSGAWLFATMWIVACQAPLSTGFSRQEYWSGLPYPPPGDFSNLGIKPVSPALQVDSLPLSHRGSPTVNITGIYLHANTKDKWPFRPVSSDEQWKKGSWEASAGQAVRLLNLLFRAPSPCLDAQLFTSPGPLEHCRTIWNWAEIRSRLWRWKCLTGEQTNSATHSFFKFYWSMVDSHVVLISAVQQSESVLYIYIYIWSHSVVSNSLRPSGL